MDIFDKLIKLHKEINEIYINLCKEDINGLSYGKGYKYLVKILKEKVSEEEKLFKELFACDEYDEIKEIIFEEENSAMIRIRDYITMFESLNVKINEEDDEELVEEKMLTMKMSKLMCTCMKNIFLVYSSFLDEFITTTEVKQIKERLLTIKYYNSFTKHDMEEVLLNCQFQTPKENYVDVYLAADILGVNIKDCDRIILNMNLGIILDMITQLMDLEDSEYEDYNKVSVIINATFMIQACFALISEKDYSINQEKIYEMIEELKKDKNKNSTNIILNIINARKEYQKRVRKISMRPYVV